MLLKVPVAMSKGVAARLGARLAKNMAAPRGRLRRGNDVMAVVRAGCELGVREV